MIDRRPRLKPDAMSGYTELVGPARHYKHNDGHTTPGGYKSWSYDADLSIYKSGHIFFHWGDKLTCIISREDALKLLSARDEYGDREWEKRG